MNRLAGRLQKLKDKGFVLIEDALSAEYCEAIAGFIDSHLDEPGGEHESGHVGTMRRIWSVEKYSSIARDCNDKCSRILSTMFGQPLQPQKILAMRDKVIRFQTQEERDRFAKGRRHYDFWTDQYEIFLSLKDVGPDNGPFEFIPGINGAFKKKFSLTRPWWLFDPSPTSRRPNALIRASLTNASRRSSTGGIPACRWKPSKERC